VLPPAAPARYGTNIAPARQPAGLAQELYRHGGTLRLGQRYSAPHRARGRRGGGRGARAESPSCHLRQVLSGGVRTPLQAGGPNRRWEEKRGDESTKGGGVVFVRVRGEKGKGMKVRGGQGEG
jgi:hypothetical protein